MRAMVVVLGVPGAYVENETPKDGVAACDAFTTKVGGVPFWPRAVTVPQGSNIMNCGVCQRQQVLVLQAYSPLPWLPERTVYVFACTNGACKNKPGSWRVVSAHPKEVLPTTLTKEVAAGSRAEEVHETQDANNENFGHEDDWGVAEADDWGAGDEFENGSRNEGETQDCASIVQTEEPDFEMMLSKLENQMQQASVQPSDRQSVASQPEPCSNMEAIASTEMGTEPTLDDLIGPSDDTYRKTELASFYICARHENV